MKWIAAAIGLVILGAWAVFLWEGRNLKPLDDEARALAPGQFADLPGGRIHYRFSGPEDGPLVVMVHGYSTPAFIFEQNASALRGAGFRVLQFDHFGRGWSDRPGGRYDADFYDSELTSLLDALAITEPAGFVGLSMGGPIVAEFAVRHPARVSRVFLFVPAGLDVAGTSGTQASLVRLPVIGDWLWRMVAMKSLMNDPQYDEAGLPEGSRLQGDVREQMAYRGYGRALLSTFRNFAMTGREETYRALAATGIPVAAMFGTDDPTVLIESATTFRAALPAAEVHILDGADHGLNYKRHEEANPVLVAWFSEEGR